MCLLDHLGSAIHRGSFLWLTLRALGPPFCFYTCSFLRDESFVFFPPSIPLSQGRLRLRQTSRAPLLIQEAVFCVSFCVFVVGRCNVDMLKMIQLGLSFANEKGELPDDGCCTWQFNFAFNLRCGVL